MPNPPTESTSTSIAERFDQLLECYYLGDYLQAPRFQNYTMDRLVELAKLQHCIHQVHPGFDRKAGAGSLRAVKSIYDKTTATSPLRKFVIEFQLTKIANVPASVIREYVEGGSDEYLSDLFERCRRSYGRSTPAVAVYEQRQCYYHDHKGEPSNFVCTKTSLWARVLLPTVCRPLQWYSHLKQRQRLSHFGSRFTSTTPTTLSSVESIFVM